jgi:hypothetical protein
MLYTYITPDAVTFQQSFVHWGLGFGHVKAALAYSFRNPWDKSVGCSTKSSHSPSHPDEWVQNFTCGRRGGLKPSPRSRYISLTNELHWQPSQPSQPFHYLNSRVIVGFASLSCGCGCVTGQVLRRIQMQSKALFFQPITEYECVKRRTPP